MCLYKNFKIVKPMSTVQILTNLEWSFACVKDVIIIEMGSFEWIVAVGWNNIKPKLLTKMNEKFVDSCFGTQRHEKSEKHFSVFGLLLQANPCSGKKQKNKPFRGLGWSIP